MPRTLIYHFDVTIPAGTSQAVPLTTLTQFEPNIVERIEWLFPTGCQGQVGIRIGARSVPVIPQGNTSWLLRSGSSAGIATDEMHETGDWSVIGYNTGSFPHTIHVTFTAHRKEPEPKLDRLITDEPALLSIGEG